MFSIGKNLTLLGKVYTPEEVLDGLNAVTMEDIDEVKHMICDMNQYSAVAVTNRRINLKSMMEG